MKKKIKGFSLLELLVVLMIMSITAGLVFGINFRQKESVIIRSFSSELSRFMRLARSYALLDGLENLCTYHKNDGRIVELLRGKDITVPEEVELVFDGAVHADPFALGVFYPDGSVIMEDFAVKSLSHTYTPELDPLMGRVDFKKES